MFRVKRAELWARHEGWHAHSEAVKGQILLHLACHSATVLPSAAPSLALFLECWLHIFMPLLLPEGVHCFC